MFSDNVYIHTCIYCQTRVLVVIKMANSVTTFTRFIPLNIFHFAVDKNEPRGILNTRQEVLRPFYFDEYAIYFYGIIEM